MATQTLDEDVQRGKLDFGREDRVTFVVLDRVPRRGGFPRRARKDDVDETLDELDADVIPVCRA